MLHIGWSEISITPDKRVSLAGQFAERISEYVEKPLTATALAVDSGSDQMVLCSVDLVGVSYNLTAAVRERLAGNAEGLDPEKVILAAIHTHTAPVYPREQRQAAVSGSSSDSRHLLEALLPPGKKYVESAPVSENPDIATPEEVLDLLVERLSAVVLDAWRKRAPGSFTNAFGRAAVGMCRRAVYSDGSAQMWGDTSTAVFTELEGGNDSGIELLYIFNEKHELTGIVANLACPAQCVQHRLFVSPDFWGETKLLLRKHFGRDLFLLPLCSAAGDQCPVDLIRWVEPESDVHDPNIVRVNPPVRKADPSMFDLAGARKAGGRIAHEIIGAYPDAVREKRDALHFEHRVEGVKLPVRMVTRQERDAAEEALNRFFASCAGKTLSFYDNASMHVHAGTLARYDYQQTHHVFEIEGHFLRLDDLAFATNPFELFLDFGNQIRAQSPAAQTFLIQLANGSLGYLPTERAEEGSHYSAYVSSGITGHVGGDLLVRETLDTLQTMFRD